MWRSAARETVRISAAPPNISVSEIEQRSRLKTCQWNLVGELSVSRVSKRRLAPSPPCLWKFHHPGSARQRNHPRFGWISPLGWANAMEVGWTQFLRKVGTKYSAVPQRRSEYPNPGITSARAHLKGRLCLWLTSYDDKEARHAIIRNIYLDPTWDKSLPLGLKCREFWFQTEFADQSLPQKLPTYNHIHWMCCYAVFTPDMPFWKTRHKSITWHVLCLWDLFLQLLRLRHPQMPSLSVTISSIFQPSGREVHVPTIAFSCVARSHRAVEIILERSKHQACAMRANRLVADMKKQLTT